MRKPGRLVRKCEYFLASLFGKEMGIFMRDKMNRLGKRKEGEMVYE